MPGKHALLNASSAARWLNCPRSVRLTEHIKDEGSTYAAEGTLAHAVAEAMLRHYQEHGSIEGWTATEDLTANEYWYNGMPDDVLPYVEYVIRSYESLGAGATLALESKLDFSEYVPGGYGTGDAVIIGNGMLEIVDLKFGTGVMVDAEGNPQPMLYGLGALLAYDFIYDIQTVRMTIVQPRLDHITTAEMSVDALLSWAAETVRPTAQLAYKGEGDQKAGEWCRWCKLKATCRVRAEALQAVVAKRKEAELTDEEIAAVLAARDDIKRWLTDLEEEISNRLLKGGTLDGWKMVEGRSNRKIKDPEKLATALLTSYSPELIYKPQELQTLTALEKLIGKKKFAENYGDYVYKPEGKPTLVPESDKRPALGSAEADFDFEEMED